MTTIAVDAMGGDNAPVAAVEGACLAARELDVDIKLVGPQPEITRILERIGHPRVKLVDAREVIHFDEQPVQAFRAKKNSTMAVGLSLVRQGAADAFVSAGSTGALLAGGLLTLGRIKGIDRPALTVIMPGASGNPFMLLDVGANTDSRARNLKEFALMGSIYAEKVMGIAAPRVALLNIGTEEFKGSEQVKQAYKMLKASRINFIGNVESRDMFDGLADVLVCDGFVGNIVLKCIEGLARTVFGLIRQEVSQDMRSKLGALMLKPYLKRVASKLDYSEYGGAPLLGLAAPCIKCHGSSDKKAIFNGIKVALRYTESRVTELVSQALKDEESGG